METGASGQIGGIDTSNEVRTRLAASSRSWRCGVCAKTNEEIMAECEERCRAAGESAETKEVEVPAELRMGFRDEMEKAKATAAAAAAAASASEGTAEDAESAELAEGFVQTVPDPIQDTPVAADTASPPPARPGQGVPAPTPTTNMPRQNSPVQFAERNQQPAYIDPNGGVPPWLDYAIMSLVMMLVAIILKIMLR